MNVACWEDENLEIYGDYDALVVGSRTWTSRALHDHCCRLAGALAQLGLAPGDRIVLLLPSGFELMVAFTAILRAGGVPVVWYPDSPSSEIERVIAHCGAKGMNAEHKACATTCVTKNGSSWVFVNTADKKVISIKNQDAISADKNLGKEVKVTGQLLDDGSLHIDSVADAK